MIGNVLKFLRDELNQHLLIDAQDEQDEKNAVELLDGAETVEPVFKTDTITLLLFNIQEERQMRQADRFQRRIPAGDSDTPDIIKRVYPDIRLYLHLLFIANHSDYAAGWNRLGRVIQYFQSHPVFAPDQAPQDDHKLPSDISKLILELIPLDFSQQNDIWNALRVSHQPCIHYRARLMVFQDQAPRDLEAATVRGAAQIKTNLWRRPAQEDSGSA